jgi:hypothetical protein
LDTHLLHKLGQKESGRRPFLTGALALAFVPFSARADSDLDPGGLTFRDFAAFDHGSSFNKLDPMIGAGAQPTQSRVLSIDDAGGFARIRFDSIKLEIALPLGWQANEDWERGVGFSEDKRYRLIAWRVDFAYEGVADAEQYASAKAGTIQSHKPGVKAQARKLADGSFLIAYQNVPDKNGPRAVFDLVVSQPGGQAKQGALITLGVPTADADRGLKLMALLKRSLRVDW